MSLLCLPCAGASASMYLRWQRWLPSRIRLVPVELPGRGERMSEAFIDDFDALVEHLCAMYEPRCNASYALYGHSMGGLIAHGMAMRWQESSRHLPDVCFVSASPAPKHRDPEYFLDKHTDAQLIDELRKQNGTPAEVFNDGELLRIVLETLRADYRVCASYRYRERAPLDVPIHVFAGRQDDIAAERILGWREETSEQFSVRWFEGGHFFIRQHERALTQLVSHYLQCDFNAVPPPAALA